MRYFAHVRHHTDTKTQRLHPEKAVLCSGGRVILIGKCSLFVPHCPHLQFNTRSRQPGFRAAAFSLTHGNA